MTDLYDSVTASAIPVTAEIVAGYTDGRYAWTPADWALFPHAYHVTISALPGNRAMVGDCEQGDRTPAQLAADLASGVVQVGYCSYATWPSVEAEVKALGLPIQKYWVAYWDGDPTIPAAWIARGCVAKQYADPPGSGGQYDKSVTVPPWPYLAGGSDMATPSAVVNPASGNIEYGIIDAQGNLWVMGILKDGKTWGNAFNVTKQCGAPPAAV
jgi:hypothetical protein